jgi:hypothetical protein
LRKQVSEKLARFKQYKVKGNKQNNNEHRRIQIMKKTLGTMAVAATAWVISHISNWDA